MTRSSALTRSPVRYMSAAENSCPVARRDELGQRRVLHADGEEGAGARRVRRRRAAVAGAERDRRLAGVGEAVDVRVGELGRDRVAAGVVAAAARAAAVDQRHALGAARVVTADLHALGVHGERFGTLPDLARPWPRLPRAIWAPKPRR